MNLLNILRYTAGLTLFVILLQNCDSGKNVRQSTDQLLVYVGTYTSGESEGIYLYKLDLSSGRLTPFSKISGIENPSFLAIHPSEKYLYSVESIGGTTGNICAYRIDPADGTLTFLNKESAEGRGPCHVIVDHEGNYVIEANYTGGNAAILPINADGSLNPASDVKQHSGSSVNPSRQQAPHPHSAWLSPDNQYVYIPDLGIDRLVAYKLDSENGKLLPVPDSDFITAPGAGPRHFTFHPNKKHAFVINELNSSITSLRYNSSDGSFEKIETVNTLPDDLSGENTCADIHVSPDGKFVYGSNRGHNSIAAFRFVEQTEQMQFIEHEPVQGDWPRNFGIDPTGKYLLVANQRSSNVVVFRINQQTGELDPTGFESEIPNPVCLIFLQLN